MRWAALAGGSLGVAGLLAACHGRPEGDGQAGQPPAGSLRALTTDVPLLSMLSAQTDSA